jgi:hypothetical protein
VTISVVSRKRLWGRAGNRCAFEGCGTELITSADQPDSGSILGEEAHIHSASDHGPRALPSMTSSERDDYANLILLCPTHHARVDTAPDVFTADALREMKAKHEGWVRTALSDFDASRQADEEFYAAIVDEWTLRTDVHNWGGWTFGLTYSDQPSVPRNRLDQLREMIPWLLGRVWPGRYPELESAFHNFRRALNDFLLVLQSQLETDDRGGVARTRRFYHIDRWDPELYDQLLNEYNDHVELVDHLVVELTKAANLVCAGVRKYLDSEFMRKEGVLLLTFGPDMKLRTTIIRAEYSPEELRNELPYKGLDAIREERAKNE